jgi:hypothetical protein
MAPSIGVSSTPQNPERSWNFLKLNPSIEKGGMLMALFGREAMSRLVSICEGVFNNELVACAAWLKLEIHCVLFGLRFGPPRDRRSPILRRSNVTDDRKTLLRSIATTSTSSSPSSDLF